MMTLYTEDVADKVASTTNGLIEILKAEGYSDNFINSGNKLRNQRTLKSYFRHELNLDRCITCQNQQGMDECYVYAVSQLKDKVKGLYIVHVCS